MNKVAHYQTLEAERVQRLMPRWKAEFGNAPRVLDFGFGLGKYLQIFSEAGFNVQGADTNGQYVQEQKNNGFDVYDAQEILETGESRFDVVFLSHLVEHVHPDDLVTLIPKLCELVHGGGLLVMLTPVLGERFYYDFSHIRPYYPQSIRHAFGQMDAPLSYETRNCMELEDIYFFKDPHKTRKLRSYYVGTGINRRFVNAVNGAFDLLWGISDGRIGVVASWLGVYRVLANDQSV